MRISEIFHSIQGEGELTGVPSVFVRSSGCNLRCRWCDTPYASWNPQGEEMAIESILDQVEKYPARHVVLTGGEPMIARGIHELASGLRELGRHITIETAGTIPPEGIPCDLASLSPKLSNSTPLEGEIDPAWIGRHEETRLQPEVISQWLRSYDFQLKFVVSGASDLVEIEAILARLDKQIPPHKVQLMPEGTDLATLRGRDETLLDLCRQHGYRYCNRLHIDLFGNARGT